MARSNDSVKRTVLAKVAPGASWQAAGQVSYRSEVGVVHARYKGRGPWSFNLNPASLRADYELWICGNAEAYYLLPAATVKAIYEHPDAYVDSRHPEIRVVSVDSVHHRATYASGGQTPNLGPYHRGTVQGSAA